MTMLRNTLATCALLTPAVATTQSTTLTVPGPGSITVIFTPAGTPTPPAPAPAPAPPPPPSSGNCIGTEKSDTAYVLTRVCSSTVTDPYRGTSLFTMLNGYADVYSEWPGTSFGSTHVIPILKNQFVSLAFTPTTPATISLTQNGSYGGGALSVSTIPGGLKYGDPAYGVICASFGGGASLTISSNGNAQASCQLNSAGTYYLNYGFVATGGGSACYATSGSCSVSFTLYRVN